MLARHQKLCVATSSLGFVNWKKNHGDDIQICRAAEQLEVLRRTSSKCQHSLVRYTLVNCRSENSSAFRCVKENSC